MIELTRTPRLTFRNIHEAFAICGNLIVGKRIGIMVPTKSDADRSQLLRMVSQLMRDFEKYLGIDRVNETKYSIRWSNGAKVKYIYPSVIKDREPAQVWFDEGLTIGDGNDD